MNDPTVNVRLDPDTRSPRTDAYSIGVDREIGRRVAASVAYVRKDGDDFIGWTDIGGRYHEETRPSRGRGRPAGVAARRPQDSAALSADQPAGYSMTYNGLVMAVEAAGQRLAGVRRLYLLESVWLAGLQRSRRRGCRSARWARRFSSPVRFGRDPNDLTNAGGRLPNDRPHMARAMAAIDVPKTGIVVAANLQHYSGKPWAASTQVSLPQNPQQRILIEPRGTRRLASQTLLDLRVSRPIRIGSGVGMEILSTS